MALGLFNCVGTAQGNAAKPGALFHPSELTVGGRLIQLRG